MNNVNAIKVDIIKVDNMNDKIKKIKKKNNNAESLDNNVVEYYLNLPIKNKKTFIKIVSEDFNIPNYKEYNHLVTINFN